MIDVVDLGRTTFDVADRLQKEAVAAGRDALVVAELEPVVTLGRGTRPGAVHRRPFPVREVERGGQATLHLPGQLVVYPVVRLEGDRRDLHAWLRRLESIVIATLADLGIEGRRLDRSTGVWVEGRKVASIGIAVRRWHSYHGFALNVDPDLSAFACIDPCGLEASVMTSLARLRPTAPPALDEVKALVVERTLEEILTPCPIP